jgi:hypothetical protein
VTGCSLSYGSPPLGTKPCRQGTSVRSVPTVDSGARTREHRDEASGGYPHGLWYESPASPPIVQQSQRVDLFLRIPPTSIGAGFREHLNGSFCSAASSSGIPDDQRHAVSARPLEGNRKSESTSPERDLTSDLNSRFRIPYSPFVRLGHRSHCGRSAKSVLGCRFGADLVAGHWAPWISRRSSAV